jgi:putative PIN family toxin of toxin-antitoxin system
MLDTNVFVSALVFSSSDMLNVIQVAATKHHLVLSTVGRDELFDVIDRKFPAKRQTVERLLQILPHSIVETPALSSSDVFTVRDANDYPILNSAIMSGVDLFVTGDKDFWEVNIAHPKIIKPWEFLA